MRGTGAIWGGALSPLVGSINTPDSLRMRSSKRRAVFSVFGGNTQRRGLAVLARSVGTGCPFFVYGRVQGGNTAAYVRADQRTECQ